MKTKIGISISIILNVCLLIFLIIPNDPSPAPFEPFHNVTEIEFDDLLSQGFEQIPIDVLMLEKTVGNLSIRYQFNEDEKCTWRNSIINLRSKEIDTLNIYDVIESYDADILSRYKESEDGFVFDKLTTPFFVQHRINKLYFKCTLDSSRTGSFEIYCSFSPPLEGDSLIEWELNFWKSQKRFGPDTTYYEDGQIHIENYYNWQVHGEDKWFRPDNSIETIRYYDRGSNTKTLRYYPTGQLKSNVLSYNLTGASSWYYPSGQLREVIHYKEGERYGEHIKYYSNGFIEFVGKYSGGDHNKGFYDIGIKDGTWNFYDSLGQVLKTEIYRNDSIIEN